MTTEKFTDTKVSFYANVRDMAGKALYLQDVFHGIRTAAYKAQVEAARALYPLPTLKGDEYKAAKQKYNEAKQHLPNFTVSGDFIRCENDKLGKFSGFIGVDFDSLENVDTAISELACDSYTVALFKSVSGHGLCVIVKVEHGRFAEAFEGLEKYYLEKYGYAVDPSGKNIARRRYVSYDPTARVYNTDAPVFKLYPQKPKGPKRQEKPFFYVNSRADIEHVFTQIEARGIDIAPNYEDWYQLGYAFLSEFGDNGEEYFQRVSQFHPDYDHDKTAKKWRMLAQQKPRTVTIAKFFGLAKKAGLELMSERTRHIATVATMQKKAGSKKESIIESLVKMDSIPYEEAKPVVEAVFESKAEIVTDETVVDKIHLYIQKNYSYRYNVIKHRLDDEKGEDIDDRFESTLYLELKRAFGKEVTKTDVQAYLNSNFIPTYNPLKDFFEKNKHIKPVGAIEQLCSSITPVLNDYAKNNVPNYVKYYVTRWLIGIVSSVHGDPSPLTLILTGKGNTGKTQFFRRLLPELLKDYYSESKMTDGKDDNMLLYSKLIIMNDEYGGNSKEAKHFKNLTSKEHVQMRKFYGRHTDAIPRLAVFCGTSNEDEVIDDPTGNRRVIPIKVERINHDVYNKTDKVAVLMEAYHLWKDGYSHHLNNEEINQLRSCALQFEESSIERELIQKYFRLAHKEDGGLSEFLSATEIKIIIEKDSVQRVSLRRLGLELKSMGFEQAIRSVNGTNKRGYTVVRL